MLFNEPKLLKSLQENIVLVRGRSFSALQRAEIAEIRRRAIPPRRDRRVSVLFNEPKLLKSTPQLNDRKTRHGFSALQRAEIAEIQAVGGFVIARMTEFQCSSTSRNC